MKVQLPRFPSSDYVETLVANLASHSIADITIDLKAFRRSRLFAESRILGLLVLAMRNDIPIYVKIGAPSKNEGNLAIKYSKTFLDSVFGLVLALLATK